MDLIVAINPAIAATTAKQQKAAASHFRESALFFNTHIKDSQMASSPDRREGAFVPKIVPLLCLECEGPLDYMIGCNRKTGVPYCKKCEIAFPPGVAGDGWRKHYANSKNVVLSTNDKDQPCLRGRRV